MTQYKFQYENKKSQSDLGGGAIELSSRTHSESYWYVIETLPRKEICAIENLASQGFDTFFPRFMKARSHARKRERIMAPVFPGYLFVRLNLENQRWAAINSTRGVKRLVGVRGGRPQKVHPEAMNILIDRCVDGLMVRLADEVRPGDLIKMNAGPFAEMLAEVESLDELGRINLLFKIMGSDQIIRVDRSDIRPFTV